MNKKQKIFLLFSIVIMTTMFFIVDEWYVGFYMALPWILLSLLLLLILQTHVRVSSKYPHRLDHFISEYDYNEYHELFIPASQEDVYAAIWKTDFGASWIIKILFLFRGLPFRRLYLKSVFQENVCMLEEQQPEECVLGMIARVWTVKGDVQKVTPEEFRNWNQSDFLKVAFNFYLDAKDNGTVLSTETRILPIDRKAKRYFKVYWAFVAPFSSLVRWAMLRRIAEEIKSS